MPEQSALQPFSKADLPAPDPWAHLLNLVCRVQVEISVVKFTVADLLSLEQGAIVDARHRERKNVPVLINRQMIGWAEFDVIEERLAVRLTELI